MDWIEKLKSLETGFPQAVPGNRERVRPDIESVVPGREMSNAAGSFYYTSEEFLAGHCHGRAVLDWMRAVQPEVFSEVGNDERLAEMDWRSAVFLDTETTGLAGGTGTVPFLIGLGTWKDDLFRIEQFFMRDFHEEAAVLTAVAERLENAGVLVSYNGKAFDASLLDTRFTLLRRPNPIRNRPHLDLLFTVRRLWRRRLAECSLSRVEQDILDFSRTGDVPGWMIPGLYFGFIRTGNGGPLAPVFQHNRWDILALVGMAGVAGRIFENPLDNLGHPLDFLSLGKALERLSRIEKAVVCFRRALDFPLSEEDRIETLSRLGFTLKRAGFWDQAIEVWESLICLPADSVWPYEELAKYYEHRLGDFEAAVRVVHRAFERIRWVQSLDPSKDLRTAGQSLRHRLDRLNRKRNDQ